ncbi:MAG: metalloregulator ArsR/SmtB family transcription factor, partial [Planctomycetota bacterium]
MSRPASRRIPALRGAPVFAALGDETRLRIVDRLCGSGPASITNLTEGSGVSRQAITKHLRILEDAGLARSSRDGRETTWRLLPGGLEDARVSIDRIARQWDVALDRLRAFVEDPTT